MLWLKMRNKSDDDDYYYYLYIAPHTHKTALIIEKKKINIKIPRLLASTATWSNDLKFPSVSFY